MIKPATQQVIDFGIIKIADYGVKLEVFENITNVKRTLLIKMLRDEGWENSTFRIKGNKVYFWKTDLYKFGHYPNIDQKNKFITVDNMYNHAYKPSNKDVTIQDSDNDKDIPVTIQNSNEVKVPININGTSLKISQNLRDQIDRERARRLAREASEKEPPDNFDYEDSIL